MRLFYDWEIQLLVLISFKLQMFLLFTGSLRRHSNDMFLRLSIWLAYLGADLVAVYALGYISRHDVITGKPHVTTGKDKLPLAFFWAPFLLIHLGGQDTITAFAIEDNNLWLRHLLNRMVQVALALYVFWKSITWHGLNILVPGFFVFLAGIIKYGERTWALRCGSLKSLQSSAGHHYKQRLPKVIDGDSGYSNTVCDALRSMQSVHSIFAARTYYITTLQIPRPFEVQDINKMPKMMEIQLGMMYDDLYTKALVLRTRSGIILRCISQVSAAVAFVLFFVSSKQRYSRVDIAITYVLFIGGFLLEVCAIFVMVVMSPWTWAWLEARKYHRLAHMSWFLLSSSIGWPEKRPAWSNSMGQYNLVSSLAVRDKPRPCKQRLMIMISKMVYLVDAEKEDWLWMNKLLDTQFVEVDKEMMECVVKGVSRLSDEIIKGNEPRQWPKLGPLLAETQGYFGEDFGTSILNMHVFTEVHLSKCHPPPPSDMEANTEAETSRRRHNVMVDACRKLSYYMIHLLVNQPSMLPLCASVEATLEMWQVSQGYGDHPRQQWEGLHSGRLRQANQTTSEKQLRAPAKRGDTGGDQGRVDRPPPVRRRQVSAGGARGAAGQRRGAPYLRLAALGPPWARGLQRHQV